MDTYVKYEVAPRDDGADTALAMRFSRHAPSVWNSALALALDSSVRFTKTRDNDSKSYTLTGKNKVNPTLLDLAQDLRIHALKYGNFGVMRVYNSLMPVGDKLRESA